MTRGALSAVGLALPGAAIRAFGAFEIAIGASAVVWPRPLTAALVAVLYGGFALFVLSSMRAGAGAPCGCFGAADTDVGALHLVLNAAACAIAIGAVVAPPPGIDWVLTREPLTAATLVLGIGAATLAAYLAFTAFPAAWRAYGAGPR